MARLLPNLLRLSTDDPPSKLTSIVTCAHRFQIEGLWSVHIHIWGHRGQTHIHTNTYSCLASSSTICTYSGTNLYIGTVTFIWGHISFFNNIKGFITPIGHWGRIVRLSLVKSQDISSELSIGAWWPTPHNNTAQPLYTGWCTGNWDGGGVISHEQRPSHGFGWKSCVQSFRKVPVWSSYIYIQNVHATSNNYAPITD